MIINNDCIGLSQGPTYIGKNFYAGGGSNSSSQITVYNSDGDNIPESLFYYFDMYTRIDVSDMSIKFDSNEVYHVKFTNANISVDYIRFNLVFMSIMTSNSTPQHMLVGCELLSTSTNIIQYVEFVNRRSFNKLFNTNANYITVNLNWTPTSLVSVNLSC